MQVLLAAWTVYLVCLLARSVSRHADPGSVHSTADTSQESFKRQASKRCSQSQILYILRVSYPHMVQWLTPCCHISYSLMQCVAAVGQKISRHQNWKTTSSFDIKAGNIFSSQVATAAVLRIHVLAELAPW